MKQFLFRLKCFTFLLCILECFSGNKARHHPQTTLSFSSNTMCFRKCVRGKLCSHEASSLASDILAFLFCLLHTPNSSTAVHHRTCCSHFLPFLYEHQSPSLLVMKLRALTLHAAAYRLVQNSKQSLMRPLSALPILWYHKSPARPDVYGRSWHWDSPSRPSPAPPLASSTLALPGSQSAIINAV